MDAKDEFRLVNRKRKQKDTDVDMPDEIAQNDLAESMEVSNSLHPSKAGSSISRKSKKQRLDVKHFKSLSFGLYAQMIKISG